MLRKISHGLYAYGVKGWEDVNGFTVSWLMVFFKPPLVVTSQTRFQIHEMIKNSGVFAIF